MGKRSDFERRERDFYKTPLSAVKPLIDFIGYEFTYAEPCAGDMALCKHIDVLTDSGAILTRASDIHPMDDAVEVDDARYVNIPPNSDYIITNPPWDRKLLHPMIENFKKQKPTWLLFDTNWMFTKQAGPYLRYCDTILTVGRIKWIEGSKHTGKDDCAWYLFTDAEVPNTKFYGRR